MMDDTRSGRSMMKLGVILAIITVTLATIWTCIYISAIYPYKDVYHGMGDADDYYNYTRESKKSYIISEIVIGVILLILLTYFWFATNTWAEIARR